MVLHAAVNNTDDACTATSPEHFPAVVSTITGISTQAIAARAIGRRGQLFWYMKSPFDSAFNRRV
jgi:hypothetical protein